MAGQKKSPLVGAIESMIMGGGGGIPADTKYPKSTIKSQGGPNKRYYDTLGVDFGDREAAAVAMNKARKGYREGSPMLPALVKLVEQSRRDIGTIPSQVPAVAAAREKERLARGAAAPKADQSRPPSAEIKNPVTPKADAEMSSVQRQIDAPGWNFRGNKLPMQEDVDLVLNAEGKDRAAGYQAFVNKFGADAAANYLEGDD